MSAVNLFVVPPAEPRQHLPDEGDMTVVDLDAAETYRGIFRGLRFVSTPDVCALEDRLGGVHTISWHAERAVRFRARVSSALHYLHGNLNAKQRSA